MKKLLFFATALAGLFLAASCQQESLEPVSGGVTYEITLPSAMQTKGADGYAEYALYYQVYKTADADALASAPLLFEKKNVKMTGNTTTVTLDLLNDQDYTILFWANKYNTDYFDLTDLRNVKVKDASSNNDDRDAFCGMDQILAHDAAKSKDVTLTRPFAQLNIATLISTTDYDIAPKSSLVKLTSVPVAYNVFTGKAVGELKEVTYGVNWVPQGNLTVNGTDYVKVAMNYLFVPDSNIDKVYYEINTDNGTVKNTINNVPVKKNYRTNIIGNLLTSNATYTVEIVPGFEEGAYVGPEFVEQPTYDAATSTWTVTNAKELAWVAASVNGTIGVQTKAGSMSKNFHKETIVLANDIDLQGAEWEPIGNEGHAFAGTFDGQEHTVSNFKVTEKAGWAGLFGRVQVGTVNNLNVKNVTIEANHYAGAIVGQGYVYMDNCHAENVNITVTIDRDADGGKGDYGDKAGGLIGQNCDGGLKVTNSSAKNVKIIGYRDLGGIAGMAHNNNVVTGNTVENITLVQNLEYGYQSTIPTTLGGVVGRFGSNVKYEGNTESGVVYDYPTVLSYDSTKSATENGQILFDTVMAAEDGDIILLTAGDWRGTDGQTSRYTVNKNISIIGLKEGVVLSSDKYGRVIDSVNSENSGVVTFKNLTMKTDHTWAAALYAKNYATVNLIDVTLQTAGQTAILLDSSNDINNQHHNANTIVNVTNVTIDEGDYVELNANPCTSYQTDIVSRASFNYDETSNIGIVKPQGITRSTGDNLFVNGVALPAGYYVTNTSELKATSGRADASVINLFPGEYELSGVAFTANNVTLKGVDKVKSVLNLSKSIYLQDKVVNLENLTYKVPTGLVYNEHEFSFIHHAKEFNLTNCNSEGRLRLNVYKSTIDGCAFNINTTSGFDGYAFYYYGNDGSKVEVKNSTFTTAGKAICVYSESAKVYDLTVTKCSFTSSNASTDKAAIQMHTEYGISGKLAINECTATGFADINGGLFNELNNQTGVPTNKFEVTFNGKEFVADGVTKEGLNYYVTNAAGLAYFSGKTAEDGAVINLESDIDFNNAEFEAIAAGYSKSFTFNGNNKTISNIKLVKCSHNSVGAASLFFCYTGGTININDLTLDNAQSEGATYAGAILGYTQGAATVKNVTVKNSSISGAKKVGGLAGFVEASTSKFLAENCKIIKTTVVATEKQAGTIIGYNAKPAELNNCTVETSTATSPLYCDGGIVCTDPAQAQLLVDGVVYVAPIIVTPENIATTDFNQSKTFKLKGDFTSVTNMPSIAPTEGVVAVIDASGATFGDKIQFNIPEVPGNSNVVSRDNARKGSYTLTNFHGTTLDLGAYGTSVTITKSTLDCIDVFATNIALDINHNTIDSNYEMHPRCNSGETDYAVYMMMMAYDLKFDNNKVSNAIGHVVAINGGKGIGNFATVANSSNEVKSFTGNTITGISGSTKNNRAGFKVWDDMTYAFQGESTYEALPQAGQALINAVENTNIFNKAEGTSNNAYKINFYEYYHAAL